MQSESTQWISAPSSPTQQQVNLGKSSAGSLGFLITPPQGLLVPWRVRWPSGTLEGNAVGVWYDMEGHSVSLVRDNHMHWHVGMEMGRW